MISINIRRQRLSFIKDGKVIKTYPISTSRFGVGNKAGSNKTPLGLHRIHSKIGRNASLGAIFVKRRNTGKIARGETAGDLITYRIIRLEGLEKGVNSGEGIDSFRRCIYIHGTSQRNCR